MTSPTDRNTLSTRLREALRDDPRPRAELAQAAQVDRAVIFRFLAGERTISLETADRLAAALRLRLVEYEAPRRDRRPKRVHDHEESQSSHSPGPTTEPL